MSSLLNVVCVSENSKNEELKHCPLLIEENFCKGLLKNIDFNFQKSNLTENFEYETSFMNDESDDESDIDEWDFEVEEEGDEDPETKCETLNIKRKLNFDEEIEESILECKHENLESCLEKNNSKNYFPRSIELFVMFILFVFILFVFVGLKKNIFDDSLRYFYDLVSHPINVLI